MSTVRRRFNSGGPDGRAEADSVVAATAGALMAALARAKMPSYAAFHDFLQKLQNDPDLWSGCISGAWYEPEFIEDFAKLGFKNLKFADRSLDPWKVIDGIEFRTVTLIGNL